SRRPARCSVRPRTEGSAVCAPYSIATRSRAKCPQGMAMKHVYRRKAPSAVWMLLAISTLTPALLNAQSRAQGIPEHATALSYGPGWQCDRGYRKENDACTAIELPAHAYHQTMAAGRGWECRRGYRTVDDDCVLIGVPPHAYLDNMGDRWKCERGY